MKFKNMKQVVAGLALSAVMLGATAFEAHPALAAEKDGKMPERTVGIYRDADDLSAQQRVDLHWFRQERSTLLKKQWQHAVDNGYMSQKEMDAHITIMQENSKRLQGTAKAKKMGYEDREAAKKFAKKYQKADKSQQEQLYKEKLKKDLAAGKINQQEHDARLVIMQERSKNLAERNKPTAEYRAQKAVFDKQLKDLNREYIKRCLANGRINAEQAQVMLTKLDQPIAKKPIKEHRAAPEKQE